MTDTFQGKPVFFDQHAEDGANAEWITTDRAIETMEHADTEGTTQPKKKHRYEAQMPRGEKVIIVRYQDMGAYWYVFSISQRRR